MFTVPGAFAEALTLTPSDAEGPFYPDKLPLDTDNDLLIVNDAITPAVGHVTHLSGVVLDIKGQPVRNALIEIWQVDNEGIYLHTEAPDTERRDKHFQSYGRFVTGSTGEYYFRTIRPKYYGRRTAHIHYAVSRKNERVLTTQLYIEGEAKNATDTLYTKIGGGDPRLQKLVTVPFKPLGGSTSGELTARMDIVLGLTPADAA
jgi:protocatechuate 3,4-dioxygenase beta subunit